ncbi:MAG: HAMP domain-containing histidine kinase [Chitinophagaceae bacterium]|nr:HAMP domain-containing histidine kinase [Oligoflexus sp.]
MLPRWARKFSGENDSTEDERVRFSRIICENVDRADQMIQDLLTASRIKAGEKIASDRKSGDIVETLRATLDFLTRIHKREFLFHTEGQITGLWDTDRVRRIVENLCGNAIKYGSASIPIRIALKGNTFGIQISVHNFGNPIPQSELKNLFNLFERSESANRGPESGWGIGLTIVRALSEEMGGHVLVESSAAAGTTFSVHLPT